MGHAVPYSPTPYPKRLVVTSKTKVQSVRAYGDWPWTMNDNEIRRLAHALDALRPDWPIASLTSFIRKHMAAWPYRDAAVALAYIACDTNTDGQPASDTPKRVLEQGPWRQAAAVGGSTAMRTHAPKRHEECPTHAGQWAHNCGGCRVDARVRDEPERPVAPFDSSDASLARALLAQAKATLCGCGVRRELCPTHRQATDEAESEAS